MYFSFGFLFLLLIENERQEDYAKNMQGYADLFFINNIE